MDVDQISQTFSVLLLDLIFVIRYASLALRHKTAITVASLWSYFTEENA